MKQKILVIGAFDTKGAEYAYLVQQIQAVGHEVLALNFGVMGTTDLFPVYIEADEVAQAGGTTLAALRAASDRGAAMQAMHDGVAALTARLHESGRIAGALAMGRWGGT